MVKKVIFDCDPGADDCWALLMLIRAEQQFNIKIVGITCTHGNTSVDNGARNVMRILEVMKRTDVSQLFQAFCTLIL